MIYLKHFFKKKKKDRICKTAVKQFKLLFQPLQIDFFTYRRES